MFSCVALSGIEGVSLANTQSLFSLMSEITPNQGISIMGWKLDGSLVLGGEVGWFFHSLGGGGGGSSTVVVLAPTAAVWWAPFLELRCVWSLTELHIKK